MKGNRILSTLMALCLLLGALLPAALAEDAVSAPVELAVGEEELLLGGDVKDEANASETAVMASADDFVIENGVLTQYNGAGGAVTIPAGVTVIGAEAFTDCFDLTGVVIPAGVTEIRDFAFYYCDSLKSVSLPDGVRSIGQEAFAACEALEEIVIPASVRTIGDRAFAGCFALSKVTLNEGLEEIGERAFYSCTELTKVTLPGTMDSIASDAFEGCTKTTVEVYEDSAIEWRASGLQDVRVTLLPPLPTALALSVSKAKLGVKQTLTIKATLSPDNAESKLTYKSDNPKVAKVSKKGVVTAVKAGKAVITVTTANKLSRKVNVTVKAAPKKVKLNKKSTVTLVEGRTLQLKTTLSPKSSVTSLKWKSSRKKVAKVSKTGLVTALKKGTTTITVATHNGKTAKVKIKVKAAKKGEISDLLGQKVKTVNKTLADPLVKSKHIEGSYQNDYFDVDVDAKGRIVSINLTSKSKRYKLLGAYPGMKRSKVLKKLKGKGMNIGLDTPGLTFFSSKKNSNKTGWFYCTSTGKCTSVYYYLAKY